MGYALRLVERLRRETNNVDYSWGNYGLGTRHFLDKLNDAQDRLQSLIVPIEPHLFETSEVISMVAGTNAYSLNTRCYERDHEVSVEYSEDGNADNYRPLYPISVTEFSYEDDDCLRGYLMRGGQIVVSPTPSSGVGRLRVNYVQEVTRLTTRIGTINTNNATSITLDAAPVPVTETILDENGTFDADYVCVVSSAGTILNSAIATTAYNPVTRVFTAAVGAGVVLTVGAWVVAGQYASSHTALPRTWDRYLVSYAKRMILAGEESSNDATAEDPVLQRIETDVMESVMSMRARAQRPVLLSGYFR